MSTHEIMEVMATWPVMSRTEHGALVHTHCMMPSGATVNVYVQPATSGFVVSDAGAALSEAHGSGVETRPFLRAVEKRLKARGLSLRAGQIFSPEVGKDGVPLAVIVVANAAKEIGEFLVSQPVRSIRPTIAEMVATLLAKKCPDKIDAGPVVIRGLSEKSYTFRECPQANGWP